MGHRNFCCDGCQTHNFHGRRFHCLRCVNYDLCGECYDQHVETLDHRVEHPMQLLIELDRHHQQLPELLLNGELLELMHLPNCYTCPYCGIFGHTAKELIDHVVTMHRQADSHVVCPMCAGLPGIELVAIRNLARHLLLNHIEHANLLDPHTPPLRHALTRVSRRRRRQQLPNTGNQNASNSRSSARSNSSRMDSEAGIDILYQLSELRRLRPELRFSQTPTNYLEGDSRSRPTALAIASPEALTNGPAHLCANDGGGSALLLDHSEADRFLLQQWMAEQHADVEATRRDNLQRQQHAIFTEHLLLSMLCDEQLQLPHNPQSQSLSQSQSQSQLQPSPVSDCTQHLLFPELDDDAQPLEKKNEDLLSLLPCKYIPSQIMMLMSLPWIRPWSTQSKLRYIELQGVTLDESTLPVAEEQDID
ncbi:E3 ubiquitin-protein ligase KCMF1 [Drosophila hydei]|uniref:E3 ubiquitin-protein ligase KCMF1 n=1 Tax=Drosophila hydei TaxID=7224 RepID=A0A6J1LR52_DROHY|nr:E3 ubiquitin-protein ligase KCMF1 [Drosophila hydei]